MRCIIEGNGVKAFGKAIHGLSRIGDELWLDPMAKGLAVRSVNSAHSAYGCFLFTPLFFQHYSLSPEGGTAKCKLAMKSVLPLFRCLATIERNVARCEISIDITENRVIFLFYCRHGITKTHMLGYQESEALQAVYPAHLCLNVLKAQSRLIAEMVMHFPASQEEITLSISPLRLLLKTHQEKCDGLKTMFTEMSLHSSEFDYFQVGVDSDITFCLKELRGLLSFAESHGLPVSVYFGEAGRPVCFSVDDMVLEARVVLATLVDPESTTPSQAEVLPPAAVRCEGVAAFPDGPQGPGLGSPRDFLAAGELIPSSQGSPVLGCAALVRQLMRPGNLERLPTASQSDRQPATISRTPASAKIRSFLFGALSTEQGNVHTDLPPSLVCASDSEDDAEEGHS